MENTVRNPDFSICVSLDDVAAKDGYDDDSFHLNKIFPNEVWQNF